MKALPWRQSALFLSLALNLFLLALISAHVLRNWQFDNVLSRQTPLQRVLIQAESALSPADRKAFDKALLAGESQFGPAADKVAIARHHLAQTLLAQPYNPTATEAALAGWQTSWVQFQTAFTPPLLNAFQALSPQGRQALVHERRTRLHTSP